jgi:ribosomal protein L22
MAMMEARAIARYVRITPKKARQVVDLVKGKDAQEALAILRHTRKRGAELVSKVLKSAIANAEHNLELDKDDLYVADVKFIMSKENDLLWLEITSQPPYRKDIVKDPMFAPYFKNNPMMSKFVVQGAYTRGVDDSKHLIEIFDAISKQYDLSCVNSRKTPKNAVRDAARDARDILAGW